MFLLVDVDVISHFQTERLRYPLEIFVHFSVAGVEYFALFVTSGQ